MDRAIAHLPDVCIHMTNGQFAAFLPAHDSCTGLGDVDLETSRTIDVAYLLEFEEFTKIEGVGADLTREVFGVPVEFEIEVDIALFSIQ